MHYAILSAGLSSRLYSDGEKQCKPLSLIAPETTLMERLAKQMCKNNAQSISLIVNERMPELVQYAKQLGEQLPVQWRVVEAFTQGSLESFALLAQVLPKEGKFCLTTVDSVFSDEEFGEFIQAAEQMPQGENTALMAVTPYVADEKPLYVTVQAATQAVTGFHDEQPTLAEDETLMVSGGIYALSAPYAIELAQQCVEQGLKRMRQYQRQLLKQCDCMKAFVFKKIIDVDHASDLETARSFVNDTHNHQNDNN